MNILVVSYTDNVRETIARQLQSFNVQSTPCSTFLEAEEIAQEGLYGGMLIDLQSIIKSKGEEKSVAYSLTNFYPSLRVRAMGSMVIPMAMPGDKRQDSTLSDFLSKTCAGFTERRLRRLRRREIILPVLLDRNKYESRGFTSDISWGGAFIVTPFPEKYTPNTDLSLFLQDMEIEIPSTIRWIRPFGMRMQPGLGVEFTNIDVELEEILRNILNHGRTNSRDRLVGR